MDFTKENTAMFALGHLANANEITSAQHKILEELHDRIMKSKLVSEEYDTQESVDEAFNTCVKTLEDYLTKEGL